VHTQAYHMLVSKHARQQTELRRLLEESSDQVGGSAPRPRRLAHLTHAGRPAIGTLHELHGWAL